jgi:Uma2 family endonuclease
MATVTGVRVGPADLGRRMSLEDFSEAAFEDGWLYELARGMVVVTEVPHPDHGEIVDRVTELFVYYKRDHPGVIRYRAAGSDCRLRLPGMQSDRHPDQAVYLRERPKGPRVWTRWIPEIVVEVVSRGGEDCDYLEKREEYLRAGVTEYWILDPTLRRLLVLKRAADTWDEIPVRDGETYRPELLPGLEVRPDELFGPSENSDSGTDDLTDENDR